MIDVIEKPAVDELKSYQGKWCNLYFETDGKSTLDTDELFNSEKEAAEKRHEITSEAWGAILLPRGYVILIENYSHLIPIPIGGA